MEISAKSAKEKADDINNKIFNAQIEYITKLIKEAVERGEYRITYDKDILKKTNDTLIDSGFKIESGGRYNEIKYVISWNQPEIKKEEKKESKLFYADGIIGKGLMDTKQYVDYVESLIERFENVSWGGVDGKFWSTEYSDVVVVLEKGVKGPADWFYLNKDHKWAHGGYTAHKETYTNAEFLIYISKILETNKKH